MAETLATYSVPEHHVAMYTGNVVAALNKQGGILMPHVSTGTYVGLKVQLIDFLGPVIFVERATPYSDTKVVELEHTSRWISGKEYDCAVFVDRLDVLKMLYDPTSPYVERFREAVARRQDAIIMTAFAADAKGGQDGTTTVSLPAGDIVAHGSTGLTVAKLRSLRKLMKQRQLDLRTVKPLIAVTAIQTDNLLGETSVTSFDYNAIKTLVDGEVSMFMGFQFIPYESYLGDGIPSYDATGAVRQCPVWVPGGMHYGSWDSLSIIVNNRPDKNNIKQIHGTFTGGATRVEEGRVFTVEAHE